MTKSSTSSTGIGNTKQFPKTKKKQISPAKHWEFTLNNYTEQDILKIESSIRSNSSPFEVFVGQSEKETTPHLQCTVSFKKKGRPLEHFANMLGHRRCSFRKVRDVKATRMYCSKEDRGSDKRNWCLVKGWQRPRGLVTVSYGILNKYQKQIVDYFRKPCHPLFSREIIWVWEPLGNVGKTILSMYFADNARCIVVGGKSNDIFCGVAKEVAEDRAPDIVIFDIPRSCKGYISYKGIEKIKDGIYYSGKYESGMCRYNRPHVLCFANRPPEMGDDIMSEDRWKVIHYDGVGYDFIVKNGEMNPKVTD